MRANRRTDTKPEKMLRSELHRLGLRFRKDYPIDLRRRKTRVDIAFPRERLAVFVDGCFWHQCPVHGSVPKANSQYWRPKLARNVARDEVVISGLTAAGWDVLRVWEHVPTTEAARLVVSRLAVLRGRDPARSL